GVQHDLELELLEDIVHVHAVAASGRLLEQILHLAVILHQALKDALLVADELVSLGVALLGHEAPPRLHRFDAPAVPVAERAAWARRVQSASMRSSRVTISSPGARVSSAAPSAPSRSARTVTRPLGASVRR